MLVVPEQTISRKTPQIRLYSRVGGLEQIPGNFIEVSISIDEEDIVLVVLLGDRW